MTKRVFLTVVILSATSPAFAQDLSMCTSTFPVACCKQSYAKYGPFGSANGQAKENRLAELQACAAKKAKK